MGGAAFRPICSDPDFFFGQDEGPSTIVGLIDSDEEEAGLSHSQSRGRKSSFGQLPRPEPDLDKRLKKEIKDLEQTFATIDVEEEPITQFNRVVGQRSWLLEKDFKLVITVRHFEFGGHLESVKSIWRRFKPSGPA